MINLQDVLEFATKAHANQRRKYTNELYINHPLEVASLVAQISMVSVQSNLFEK